MKKYYTIFLGNKIWENCIDDMNQGKIWGMGGLLWNSKKKANACIQNLKRYDFEEKDKKFRVVEMFIV